MVPGPDLEGLRLSDPFDGELWSGLRTGAGRRTQTRNGECGMWNGLDSRGWG